MTTTLVLGGTRSGKSRHAQTSAEALAESTGRKPTMIVTAEVLDAEMADRVARHQADRDDRWTTVEAPLDLAGTIASLKADDIAVVDCLTLWLSNAMIDEDGLEARMDELVAAVAGCPAEIWLVSNEVGWGIVPDNALARRFRDHAGRLHQALAAVADRVVLVVAGLPMVLKGAEATAG